MRKAHRCLGGYGAIGGCGPSEATIRMIEASLGKNTWKFRDDGFNEQFRALLHALLKEITPAGPSQQDIPQ